MKAYLAVLIVLGLQMSPLAAADKKKAPKPLPPEIVQTWRDAGANVGWMNMNLHLNRHVFAAEGEAKIPREWWDRTSAMPVFQFSEWEEGVLAKLPDPGAPFGLCLNLTKVTDAGLKELAGRKSLQALYLAGNGRGSETQVTDAGLKELAGRKSLQILDVRGTKVTDAGLKELAGLKSLQLLNLAHCPGVTDAGLKDLGALKSLKDLRIYLTKVTAAGTAALRKDLPACNIH